MSLWINLTTAGDARKILIEKKRIKSKEVKLPKQFDTTNLNNLFVDQFVAWDEVHSKSIHVSDDGYTCTTYKDQIMKFPRDDNGNLDVSSRTYSRKK